ncbi:MAG: hypothetical protein Q7U58_05835 [Hydrogenophaga sp.]|nr:hypothetical protein [Hydrogenophaga sp.]
MLEAATGQQDPHALVPLPATAERFNAFCGAGSWHQPLKLPIQVLLFFQLLI